MAKMAKYDIKPVLLYILFKSSKKSLLSSFGQSPFVISPPLCGKVIQDNVDKQVSYKKMLYKLTVTYKLGYILYIQTL
jgi:hypothetical protein